MWPICTWRPGNGQQAGVGQVPSYLAFCPPSNRQRQRWRGTARQVGRRDLPLQPPANRHRPLALMAFVPRKPETHERLGEPALPALLWLSQWNREGPKAKSRVRVEGEKRASLFHRVMNSRSVALGSCQSTTSWWIQRVQAVIASLKRGSLAGRGPVAIGAPSRRFRLGLRCCGYERS